MADPTQPKPFDPNFNGATAPQQYEAPPSYQFAVHGQPLTQTPLAYGAVQPPPCAAPSNQYNVNIGTPPPTVMPNRVYLIGRQPQLLYCPSCRREVPTSTDTISGLCTWLLAAGLCFFGCCLCAPLAFCMDSTKDIEHFCSICHSYLGTCRAG